MRLRRAVTVVGVAIWLAALLTIPDAAFAQSVPGYRMRFPVGVQVGASGRPPRLTVPTERSLEKRGRPFRRQFADPFENFGWYFVGPDDYVYRDDSTDQTHSTATEPARDIYPVYDSVPDVGRLEVSSRPVGSGTVVRLTWPNRAVAAAQVAFFLADTAKAVLSAQTDRSPPFTALFELPPGTAFAGMTVVLPNGSLVTQYTPFTKTTHRSPRTAPPEPSR